MHFDGRDRRDRLPVEGFLSVEHDAAPVDFRLAVDDVVVLGLDLGPSVLGSSVALVRRVGVEVVALVVAGRDRVVDRLVGVVVVHVAGAAPSRRPGRRGPSVQRLLGVRRSVVVALVVLTYSDDRCVVLLARPFLRL